MWAVHLVDESPICQWMAVVDGIYVQLCAFAMVVSLKFSYTSHGSFAATADPQAMAPVAASIDGWCSFTTVNSIYSTPLLCCRTCSYYLLRRSIARQGFFSEDGFSTERPTAL